MRSKIPGKREMIMTLDRAIKGNLVAAKKHGFLQKDPIDQEL